MNKVIFILFFMTFYSCTEEMKFDARKWNDQADRGYYNNRNAMLNDLIENHNLIGMDITELKSLFGYVDYDSTKNQTIISFEVYQTWRGIEPDYTKYLNLKLNNQKLVDSIFIDEYER